MTISKRKKGQSPTHDSHHEERERLPRFIDHNGVHCGVAYMILKSSGFEHLPNEINQTYEYSFIDETQFRKCLRKPLA
ncbi:hypothetical protein I4U23_017298 [Adineta vaga]|nr:hypothetical protein I4U23_017298 [Adineta vaga]